jgi:hypothetical protein
VEVAVTHEVDALMALNHFIKVCNNVIAFFSSKAVKVLQVDDEGLMPFIFMHACKASLHIKGSLALVYMNHLRVGEIALYLHLCEGIV